MGLREIAVDFGTGMDDETVIFKTDAPATVLARLTKKCNDLYIAGAEEIPFWRDALKEEGYECHPIDQHDHVTPFGDSHTWKNAYYMMAPHYIIENQVSIAMRLVEDTVRSMSKDAISYFEKHRNQSCLYYVLPSAKLMKACPKEMISLHNDEFHLLRLCSCFEQYPEVATAISLADNIADVSIDIIPSGTVLRSYYDAAVEEIRKNESKELTYLEQVLKAHCGHRVTIVQYANGSYSLECLDCNEVLMDTETYDLCANEN